MSREKLYGLTGIAPKKPLSGQALLVFNTMNTRDPETDELVFDTPKSWTSKVKGLVTRQDEYRVVLYYILIFKNRGLVAARDQEAVEAVESGEADSVESVLETAADLATEDASELEPA